VIVFGDDKLKNNKEKRLKSDDKAIPITGLERP